jgi:hypothetical protein
VSFFFFFSLNLYTPSVESPRGLRPPISNPRPLRIYSISLHLTALRIRTGMSSPSSDPPTLTLAAHVANSAKPVLARKSSNSRSAEVAPTAQQRAASTGGLLGLGASDRALAMPASVSTISSSSNSAFSFGSVPASAASAAPGSLGRASSPLAIERLVRFHSRWSNEVRQIDRSHLALVLVRLRDLTTFGFPVGTSPHL